MSINIIFLLGFMNATASGNTVSVYVCMCVCVCVCAVLEITVGLRTLSDHCGHLSDPKMLGSDIWPNTIKGPLP